MPYDSRPRLKRVNSETTITTECGNLTNGIGMNVDGRQSTTGRGIYLCMKKLIKMSPMHAITICFSSKRSKKIDRIEAGKSLGSEEITLAENFC